LSHATDGGWRRHLLLNHAMLYALVMYHDDDGPGDEPSPELLRVQIQASAWLVEELVRRGVLDRRTSATLLTAKGELPDRIVGLRRGAEDAVEDPLSPEELVARAAEVLRRIEPPPDAANGKLSFDGLEIDPVAGRVAVDGEEVRLTMREYTLLLFLARHPGEVFSRDQLMDAVWEYSFHPDTSTVTVHIRRVRAKIEADPAAPRWLQTVRGIGYRFQP
jgi:two-component system response regulator ResD